MWRWTELPRYARFCRDLAERLGVPYEHDFDVVRWAIEETLCWEPVRPSHPDPRFEDDSWCYFRTSAAPALIRLPPLVVTFRIARYPQLGERGVLEGREIWVEDDLRQVGFDVVSAES